jgi:hypothetical protein
MKTEKEIKEVLDKLQKLDLSLEPYDEVKTLLFELGNIGIVTTILHSGKKILRGRINEEYNKSYIKISDLSYKPQEKNTSYLRASTPHKTMFYGAIVSEELGKEEPTTSRITILAELSDFARDPQSVGIQKITFSSWKIVEDIELASLIHHKDYEKLPKLVKKLQSEFEKFINKYPDYKDIIGEINAFLGKQFAKKIEPGKNYDYLISAVFAETITELGFDGVLYPSVKLDGAGINIALNPNVIGTKVKFIGAGECTIYKNKLKKTIGNDTWTPNVEENRDLEYEQVAAPYYTSFEEGLKQVGLESSDIEILSDKNPKYIIPVKKNESIAIKSGVTAKSHNGFLALYRRKNRKHKFRKWIWIKKTYKRIQRRKRK